MITLEDGLTLSGRCVWGLHVGFITAVTSKTYRVRWLDGSETEQLRPDVDEASLEVAA